MKYFTLEEANRTLPLVRRIVTDILETGQKIRILVAYLGEQAETHPDVERLISQLDRYFVELEELGCYFKDWGFNIGIVDFPAIINDEQVFLCWRSDEPAITYYHRKKEGYKGRRRLPDSVLG